MKNLNLTKKEYDKSVLLISFVSEAKSALDKHKEIKDVCFTPKIKGYEITYINKGVSVKIILKLGFFGRLKIYNYENGILKSKCTAKKAEESKKAAQKIFAEYL